MTLDRFFDRQLRENPSAAEAFRVVDRLREAGFVAYLAGGCVRDALLGKVPKDYDVATNAVPQAVRRTFGHSSTLAFGASFGVIGVLPEMGRHDGDSRARTEHRSKKISLAKAADQSRMTPTEVATFRSDGGYSDGRRPDSVHFGDARQDALRRDFTVNGLFYDPATRSVIDYVDGQRDLESGTLRTIRSADQRFDEDKLRMLRAIRFATTLGFQIEPDTLAAIQQHAGEIAVVSGERIGAEMTKVLSSPRVMTGLELLLKSGLADRVMPDLRDVNRDRLEVAVGNLPRICPVTVLACVAIVSGRGGGFASEIGSLWKLSTEQTRRTNTAIKHYRTLLRADQLAWSVVQPVVVDRDRDDILAVAHAMAKVEGHPGDGLAKVQAATTWPTEQLDPPPLLSGNDLQALGLPAGPLYRKLLKHVRDDQLDGKLTSMQQAKDLVTRLADEAL